MIAVQRSYKEIKRLFREPLVVLFNYVSVPTTSRCWLHIGVISNGNSSDLCIQGNIIRGSENHEWRVPLFQGN